MHTVHKVQPMSAPISFRGRMVALAVTGIFTAGLAAGATIAFVAYPDAEQDHQAPSEAEILTRQLGCWTGASDMPADMKGVVPGHVVVTTEDGQTRYAGKAMVAKALDQQFGGKPAGLTIHSFCR